jgi:hypothetical protein
MYIIYLCYSIAFLVLTEELGKNQVEKILGLAVVRNPLENK